jgi:hypothetical protein
MTHRQTSRKPHYENEKEKMFTFIVGLDMPPSFGGNNTTVTST